MTSSDIRDAFFQECEDLLEALSEGLRQMDAEDHEMETVHAVFRAVHSIKGGAGAFGLDALVAFAHRFETALDRIRSGDLAADAQAMRLFHRSGDHLGDLVAAARDGDTAEDPQGAQLLAELDEMAGEEEDIGEVVFEPLTLDFGLMAPPPAAARWRIDFAPTPALYASGTIRRCCFAACAGWAIWRSRPTARRCRRWTRRDCWSPACAGRCI